MFKMGKWFIRWGQLLFVLNIVSFFLTGSVMSLVFAGGIALMLYFDSKIPVPVEKPADKKE
jgi:hypothetical protein